jgi:hypothetical protein
MSKSSILIGLLAVVFPSSGATLFQGTNEEVTIESDPPCGKRTGRPTSSLSIVRPSRMSGWLHPVLLLTIFGVAVMFVVLGNLLGPSATPLPGVSAAPTIASLVPPAPAPVTVRDELGKMHHDAEVIGNDGTRIGTAHAGHVVHIIGSTADGHFWIRRHDGREGAISAGSATVVGPWANSEPARKGSP